MMDMDLWNFVEDVVDLIAVDDIFFFQWQVVFLFE